MVWKCCWTTEEVGEDECPSIEADEADLYVSLQRRFVAKCIECPRFGEDLDRLSETGHPSAPVLRLLIDEIQRQKTLMNSMAAFLDNMNMEARFLHEIGVVLQTPLGLDEVLSVALTAFTAGKGFGMNRAFLLLADKERRFLRGTLGVGPRDYQEAWEIWDEVSRKDFSLKEMARHFYDMKLSAEKDKFHDILERLTVSLADQAHILNRALLERRPILVEDAPRNPDVDPLLVSILGVDTFLILPLISRNRRIGVILADNFITHRQITPQDVKSMETLTFPVAFAIERAALYERLHEDLRKLTRANTKLLEQQELIVRMEKLALLGKITSSISHSIRNPLMVIGGFARSLLKDIPSDDPKRESLQTIVREARLLEDALDEALAYADSALPALDRWDVNQLVGNVFREVVKNVAGDRMSCILELSPDLPTIYTDYRQIAYCIKKLLRYNLEMMGAAGELYMGTLLDGESILVEIRFCPEQHGHGVDEPVFPGLGEEDGTKGMELSICRVILENYCKSFTVEEYGSNGRRYTLRLPLKKEGT
jgi:GAF domain-containing protein